jgi:preprotein translocase subunit SecE
MTRAEAWVYFLIVSAMLLGIALIVWRLKGHL